MYESYYPHYCFIFSVGLIVTILIHTYREIKDTWEASKLWTPVYTLRD